MVMKKLLARILEELGYCIFKKDARNTQELCIRSLVSQHAITDIIDVGANIGQFSRGVREHGFKGAIYSIEPQATAHECLVTNARDDPNWKVLDRCAVGASEGEGELNISQNSVSSSLCEMEDLHLRAAPDSRYCRKETVPIRTLGGLLGEFLTNESRLLVKIDVQGAEEAVVKGCDGIIDKIEVFSLELSFTPLYKSNFYFEDGIALMDSLGFRLYAIYPFFQDRTTGQCYQADCYFVRPAAGPPNEL